MHNDSDFRDQLARLGTATKVNRVRLRLSQLELGERADMHRSYIGAIERGETNPTYLTLRRLARALEMPLPDLIVAADGDREPGA